MVRTEKDKKEMEKQPNFSKISIFVSLLALFFSLFSLLDPSFMFVERDYENISSDIIPGNSSYFIGREGEEWRSLYLSNATISSKETILPVNDPGNVSLNKSQMYISLDENSNELVFQVKYSNGTIKNGTVLLE